MIGEITWREMNSQPSAWVDLIGRLKSGALKLPVDLAAYDEFLLLGSGTSYYLALAVADWMRRRGYDARAVPSCEVMLDSYETRKSDARRLAIGFSRSGKSSELVIADRILREAGFTTLGISCTEGSDLLAKADHGLLIREGYEDGLVMLRSFTSMMIALQWLSGTDEDRRQLAALPEAGATLLKGHSEQLRALANAAAFDRFVFLGSGPSHPLTLEGALKIQEMAISTSEAYHSLDYRHGPKACANGSTVAVLYTLSDRLHGVSLARDLKALGTTVLVVGSDADAYEEFADLKVKTPGELDEGQAAVLLILPLQLFAFETAIRRGQNPDAPVNLSKVVVF